MGQTMALSAHRWTALQQRRGRFCEYGSRLDRVENKDRQDIQYPELDPEHAQIDPDVNTPSNKSGNNSIQHYAFSLAFAHPSNIFLCISTLYHSRHSLSKAVIVGSD
jgi:hypothetical protein